MVSQKALSRRWSSAAARRLCSRAGDAPDIPTAVRTLANELLDGVTCPPTDLQQVASRLRVVEIKTGDIPGSGELHKVGEEFIILTAEDLPNARKRFTIAHELGHALMEETGAHAPRTGRELERLCDLIATELLMPSDQFQKRLPGALTLSEIWRLAREFDVSFLAAAFRCVELGKVSIMEIADQRIALSRGPFKARSWRELDVSLKEILRDAKDKGEVNLYLRHNERIREWRVECQSRGRGRTFVLLYPLRKEIRSE